MRTASFQLKVLLALVSLVALAQLSSTVAVLYATDRSALHRGSANLSVAAGVLTEQLATRTRYLQASVAALVADFGFRHAVASDDTPTMLQLMLERARVRAGAGIVMLVSEEGRLRASTSIALDREQPFPFPQLLARARQEGASSAVVTLDARMWKLVMVPVLSPARIAWVSMGFPVDDGVARELKSLTGVEVSFRMAGSVGPGLLLASTLPEPERLAMARALARGSAGARVRPSPVEGTGYLAVERSLAVHDGATLSAVLQIPLDRVYGDFAELRLQLVLLSVTALLGATLLAVLMARGVTRPVRVLAEAAERVADGDYTAAVASNARDEMGRLADAFNTMLGAIARRETRILHQSRHDTLTDLPNRLLARERLERSIGAPGGRGALLMLDLLAFRNISETLGYHNGDLVLIEVARRLGAGVRDIDTVARVGGDEFLVLLDGMDAEPALTAAARLVSSLREPVVLADTPVTLQVSAGLALFPAHGAEAEVLLRRVEEAMHSARDSPAGLAVYESGQDERRLRRLTITRDLHEAIESDALELRYQPKLDLATGEACGCEVLVRWTHPTLGSISPQEFVGIAEQSGTIRPLTRWVLRRALQQARDWHQAGLPIGVAINLSALDLLDFDLPSLVEGRVVAHGIPRAMVTLEITESAVMRDPELSLDVLARLRAAGVKLSIDDFGVGYSSLAQLRRLPVDELKIDASFVANMLQDPDAESIVRMTIELAHQMGLRVVGEGVECEAQLLRLRELGCDVAQGYLLSRPVSAAALQEWFGQDASRALPVTASRRAGPVRGVGRG